MAPDISSYQKKIADLEAENQLLRQQLLAAQPIGQQTVQPIRGLQASEASRHRSDRQATEARLNQQAAQYQQIFETITDGLGIINLEIGELVEANPAYYQMHGYTYDEFMAVPLGHHVHPDSLPLLAQFVEEIRAGRTFTCNAQNIHRQGHVLDIEVKGIPYPYNGTTHALAIVRNVSDRNRMAANLRLSEARLTAAFEQAAVGFAESEMQTGRLTLVNTRFCEMTGYSRDELAGMTVADLTYPEDGTASKQAIQLLFSGQIEHFTLEKRYLCKGGSFFWSETTVYLVNPPDQQVTYCMAVVQDISQRKRLEAERKAAEKALKLTRFAVENAATSLFWVSNSGQIIDSNQSAYRALGYTPEELKTKFVWDITPNFSRDQWPEHYQALQEQPYLRFEAEHQTKEQAIFPVEITSNYLEYDDQGYIFAQVQNIRDRKASEDALKQSEEKFRTLVGNINGAVYRCKNDADWTMAFISDAIANLSGYPATDFIQNRVRTYNSIIHPDDTNHIDVSVAQAIDAREPFTLEYRIIHQDGSIRWVHEKGKGIFDQTDQLLFIEGVFFDVSDVKKAEAEKLAYQKKLEFLIQETTLGMTEWDAQFRITAWNPAAEKIFGYSAEEMVGKNTICIIPPELQPNIDDIRAALIEGRGGNYSVNENMTKEGRRITCEWINTILYDNQQQILGIYSIVQDVTARTQAETDLKQSEASLRLQALALTELSQSPAISQGQIDAAFREITERAAHVLGVDRVSIWLFDPDHTKLCCQDLFELATQRHSADQELLVADYPNYFAALKREGSLAIDNAQNDARTSEFVEPYLIPLGVTSVLDATLGSDGKISGVFFLEAMGALRHWQTAEQNFSRSVANLINLVIEAHQRQQKTQELKQTLNQLQQAQTQLVQSEKMSSVGQLVAGVAHEINNPVSFIHGNLLHAKQYVNDLLGLIDRYQTHYPNPHPEVADKIEAIDLEFLQEDICKLLNSMNVGTERIQKIVQSLRNFSRLDEAEVKDVDLHEGIDSTLLILQTRLRAQNWRPEIPVLKDYGDLPLLKCYAGQLNQVFMNLLSNAIDALEERDENRTLDQMEQDPSTIQIRTRWLAEGGAEAIEIAITDNGPGIDAVTRDRLFNPFFTTKAIGKGTGLGLSISYQIITEKHRGTLEVNSEGSQGAEFVIRLPL